MRSGLQAATCLVVVAVLLASGCAMYGYGLRDVDAAFQQGRPGEALARLDGLGGGMRNEALYHVNRGALLRATGDLGGSIAAFEAAKPLLTYQEATSVSETAGRWTLAEGTTSYQPRPFERLQVHVLQALNQLERGNWDGARVEAVQIDLYLRRQFDGEAPQGGDAFARYLSGIIYEGLGEESDALVAYRKALQAYDRSDNLRVPPDLERRLLVYTRRLGLDEESAALADRFGEQRLAEAGELAELLASDAMGELIVVATTGLVPRRRQVSSLHQDYRSGKVYRLSLPTLQSRSSYTTAVTLQDGERQLARSQPVEDLAGAARRALDNEMPGLVTRAIARNVVKNQVANEAGEEHQGLEFLVNIASAAFENADVRSWSTLPERIHLLRARLPVGEHDLRLTFGDRGNAEAARLLDNIDVNSKRPVVIGVDDKVSRGEIGQ